MEQYLINGHFHQQERAFTGWVKLQDNRIAAMGTGEAEGISPEAIVTDLKGAHVYPGMVDTHLHILSKAITERGLVLDQVRSRDIMLQMIRDRAAKTPKGEKISARGFNEDLWEDRRLPTLAELDEAAGDHPLTLTRVCGHMMMVNRAAMQANGIDAATPVPAGSRLDLENGIVTENAIPLFTENTPDRGVAACKEALLEGLNSAADAGLTGLYSDDFCTDGFGIETVIRAYQELAAEDRMPVRVVQQCMLTTNDILNTFLQNGHHWNEGNDLYRIGPRKLYADGSLGARTAFLRRPYADQPDTHGSEVATQDEMNALLAAGHRAGMPTVVHCIGDGAVQRVLDAIRFARETVPGTDEIPDGLVHCQITDAAQLRQIREMKVQVLAQPVFTEYDLHICRDRVGAEMEKTSYNWRTLYEDGVLITSGSDCPIESLEPVKNIYCAVTRKDYDHYPPEGWMPEQRLTPRQAIDCHTAKAAQAAGYADRLGQIREGYLADFSIFDKSFEDVDPDDILSIRPVMTVMNGRVRVCDQKGECK